MFTIIFTTLLALASVILYIRDYNTRRKKAARLRKLAVLKEQKKPLSPFAGELQVTPQFQKESIRSSLLLLGLVARIQLVPCGLLACILHL